MYAKTARRYSFDTAYAFYTVALTAYALTTLCRTLGMTEFLIDEDFFIAHFPAFAWATLACLLLAVTLTWLSDFIGITTLGQVLFASPAEKGNLSPSALFTTLWGLHLTGVFALSVVVSLHVTEASWNEMLDPNGLQGAWRLWSGLTHPNWEVLPRAIAKATETIFIAMLATVIAIPIAFVLAFFAAKNIMTSPLQAVVYSFLRILLNIARSVEPLIWALIFTVWVGVGPFAGMLALMIHSAASLIKYYSEIIESVNEGPIDGVRSTGANRIQVIWYAIVPQVVLPYIAMTFYRWDTNVRMATVIGLVGGGGIGTLLIQYQGQAMWPEVGCIIFVIAVIVWLMDAASAFIREALT